MSSSLAVSIGMLTGVRLLSRSVSFSTTCSAFAGSVSIRAAIFGPLELSLSIASARFLPSSTFRSSGRVRPNSSVRLFESSSRPPVFCSCVQMLSTIFSPPVIANAPAVVSGNFPTMSPAVAVLDIRFLSPRVTPFSSTYCASNRSAAAKLPSGRALRCAAGSLLPAASPIALKSAQNAT